MIPRKFEPFLVGAVLSGLMSWVVSGIATLKAVGQAPDFLTADKNLLTRTRVSRAVRVHASHRASGCRQATVPHPECLR